MKEIKAYVRVKRIDPIVHALKTVGIHEMSVIHVREVGKAIDPANLKISFELVCQYTEMVKLEIVCPDSRTEEIIHIIETEGHTGFAGDGMIYVSPVEDAIKIRTGNRGLAALT